MELIKNKNCFHCEQLKHWQHIDGNGKSIDSDEIISWWNYKPTDIY